MGSSRRIKVGIFFNARREQGGLYQYATTLVDCLLDYAPQFDYVFFHATLEPLYRNIQAENWSVIHFQRRSLQFRMGIEAALMQIARTGYQMPLHALPIYPEMRQYPVDLMIYVKPSIQPFLWDFPAIFPIHDLQHRLQPHFPEVSARGEGKRRDYMYQNSIPRARAVLADSEVGREDIICQYHAQPENVYSLPYLASNHFSKAPKHSDIERVKEKYAIPDKFFFYPAAFWPHKNHARILHAIHYLKSKKSVIIPLVLAGSYRHDYEKIHKIAESLDILDQVHFLGYVPDEHMGPLYKLATALIMPTYFGPTNIPVLEAWGSGCPVITSNIRGIKEQVGNAGLLINPDSTEEIADAIWRLWSEPELCHQLIIEGQKRINEWKPLQFTEKLSQVLINSVDSYDAR